MLFGADDFVNHNMQVGEVPYARDDVHTDNLSTGARDQDSDEAEMSQVYTHIWHHGALTFWALCLL